MKTYFEEGASNASINIMKKIWEKNQKITKQTNSEKQKGHLEKH